MIQTRYGFQASWSPYSDSTTCNGNRDFNIVSVVYGLPVQAWIREIILTNPNKNSNSDASDPKPKPQWNIDNLCLPRRNLSRAWTAPQTDFRAKISTPTNYFVFGWLRCTLTRFHSQLSAFRWLGLHLSDTGAHTSEILNPCRGSEEGCSNFSTSRPPPFPFPYPLFSYLC